MLTTAIIVAALAGFALGFVGGRGFWTDRGLAQAEDIITAELDRRVDEAMDEMRDEVIDVYIEELRAVQDQHIV